MQLQIDNRFKVLNGYLDRVKAAASDPEAQTYLCKFGAVLICGNVERCIEIIILSRLTVLAQPKVLEFIKSHFKRGQNLDCNSIEQLLIRFDAGWYRDFHDFCERHAEIREGITSCYALRNSIAHGGSANVGYVRLKELADMSRILVDAVVSSTA